MLWSPLQGLQNEHVEGSLQQLNSVFILIFLAHRCRHSTRLEVDCLLPLYGGNHRAFPPDHSLFESASPQWILSAVFGPIGGHSREAIGLVNTGRLLVTNLLNFSGPLSSFE